MKRLIYFVAILLLTSACTTEEIALIRAERLAEKETVQMLYVPDSYEAIKTSTDSLFLSKYTDIEILRAAAKIIEIKENTSVGTLSQSIDSINEQMELIKARAEEIEGEKRHIGWAIEHRYRADNRLGHPDISEILIFADNTISEAIVSFSLDSDDSYSYQAIKSVIDSTTKIEEFRQNFSNSASAIVEEIESLDIDSIYESIEGSVEELYTDIEDFATEIAEEVEEESVTLIEEIESISSEITESFSKRSESHSSSSNKKQSIEIIEESYLDDFGSSTANDMTLDNDMIIDLNSL